MDNKREFCERAPNAVVVIVSSRDANWSFEIEEHGEGSDGLTMVSSPSETSRNSDKLETGRSPSWPETGSVDTHGWVSRE